MFENEVAQGSAWLDEMSPGWWKAVDVKTLNLGSYMGCTLGTIFGDVASRNLCADSQFSLPRGFICYVAIPKPITVTSRWSGTKTVINQEAIDAAKKQLEDNYRILTGVWIREILRRRAVERMAQEATARATVRGIA